MVAIANIIIIIIIIAVPVINVIPCASSHVWSTTPCTDTIGVIVIVIVNTIFPIPVPIPVNIVNVGIREYFLPA